MLKQRFMVHFGSTIIPHLVGMLAGIVVARVAGPTVVGTLSYATAYVGIFGFVNGIFGPPHIKLASEGRNHEACMAVITRISISTGAIYFFMTLGWFLVQKYVLHYPFESKEVQIVIVITLLAHVVLKVEGFANTVFTAKLKQARANVPTFIRTLVYQLGRVGIVLLGGAAVALAAWNLLVIVLFVPFLIRLLRGYKIGSYDPILAREYFRYAVPIFVIVVVNAITHYADKLMLAHYTDTTQLGYYSAAHSIGGLFVMVAVPVGSIFFPLFSGLIAKGDWMSVNNNIRRYQEFIALFIFPLVCALAVAGGPALLLLLGQRYQPSLNPFIILLFATYFTLWGMPYGNIISGMGKFNLSALINAVKLLIFVISITLFLSPKFLNLGAVGLAFNVLVLNLAGNGLNIMLAQKLGDVHINARNHLRHLVILTVTAGGYFAASYLKQRMGLWWLLYIPASLALTYLALILLKLITREHWLLLWDAANLKKTFAYVNDEMKRGE